VTVARAPGDSDEPAPAAAEPGGTDAHAPARAALETAEADPEDPDLDADDAGERVEIVAITDVLDLHSFLPREVPDVVRDYLDAAYEKGLRRLRLIHGRGAGVQRRTVRTLLERDPRVVEFGDAPPEAGGWGATWVSLR
jgi:DNA-nicking Smr family endonuclease